MPALIVVPPEKLLGVDVRDFIHPEDGELVLPLVRAERLRPDSEVRRAQFRMRRADGATRHTLASYIPDIVAGEVQGFNAVLTDVSEIKLAELKLEQLN